MPETRTITTYKYPDDLEPDQRTIDKAIITTTTYEVSDEQLAEERKMQRMANMLDELDTIQQEIKNIKKTLVALTKQQSLPK